MIGSRPIRVGRRTPAARIVALVTAAAMTTATLPVKAQPTPRGMPIIRDAEIEQLLRDYTQPVLRAAGLSQQNVQVVIINERAFNAFVVDGRRIFVNSGALMDSQTPNQIIGVLAHETGHIAGGHLSRLREQLATAQTQSIIAMLLGVGAMVAGARSGSQGAGDIGMAALTAPQEAIRRSLLSYQRTQEEAADRAGVKFLNATGQSAKGMYDTFKRFAEQTMFVSKFIDPYVQSHPMPTERVAGLAELAKTNPYWERKDSPELQLRHDLMRAKLSGFMERPDTIATATRAARWARSTASSRRSPTIRIFTSSRARLCSKAAMAPKQSPRCVAPSSSRPSPRSSRSCSARR
jgi:predicted Zn-dependent protease